jgi:hypothetical protein
VDEIMKGFSTIQIISYHGDALTEERSFKYITEWNGLKEIKGLKFELGC